MPKIFNIPANTPEEICLFIENTNPAEVIITLQTTQLDNFHTMQKLMIALRAMLTLGSKQYTILIKPFSIFKTFDQYIIVEIASLLLEPSINRNRVTIKIPRKYICSALSAKVNGVLQTKNSDLQIQPHHFESVANQIELNQGGIAHAIVSAYQNELDFIKARTKCREAIAKINSMHDELINQQSIEMASQVESKVISQIIPKEDIESFWRDFYQTKQIKELEALADEAEEYLVTVKTDISSTRMNPIDQKITTISSNVSTGPQSLNPVSQDFIRSTFFTIYPNDTQKKQSVRTKPYDKILIPTYEAQLLLAEYYRRKYGIQIIILRNWKQELAIYVKKLLQIKSIKVGIIIWTGTLPEEHVVPLVFDSSSDKKLLIDLDCLGYGKLEEDPWNQNEKRFNIDKLAEYLNTNLLGNEIYLFVNGSSFDIERATRQVDQHSCFTDAITVLKEALLDKEGIQAKLRINPQQIHNVQADRIHNYNFFALPGNWSVSVQNKQCLTYNHIDPATTFLRARLNKKTQIVEQQLLRDFFARHTHVVTICDSVRMQNIDKEINCYLQQKSHKLIDMLLKLYESISEAELIVIYNNRRGAVIDQLVIDASKKPEETSIKP